VTLGSLLGVALAAGTPLAQAATIPSGEARGTAELGPVGLPVFTYRPAECQPRALLIVFHGTSRNAAAYRAHARPLADRVCAVVVAPQFEKAAFPRDLYQYGGTAKEPPGQRTIDLVPGLAAWARAAAGTPSIPFILIGHSAGAQFLDRVAAFVPTGAAAIILANPSTWVLPSTTTPVPFGFAGSSSNPGAVLGAYLAAPISVLLGAADTGSKDLATSAAAMAQGPNRLARGLATFRAAQLAAAQRGRTLAWTLAEVPGVGHDATAMFSSPQALAAVERALAAIGR
jgi:poly(3-hydroxybutyrate) depolymerase